MKMGVQIEWKEFNTYAPYMRSLNDAAVQAEVHLKPHTVDIAMMYLHFCMSREGAKVIHNEQQKTI